MEEQLDPSTIYQRRQAFLAQYQALCSENVATGSGLENHEILSLLMVKKGEGFDLAHVAENTGLSVQQVEALGEATDCLDAYIQILLPLPSVQGVSSLPAGLRMFVATDPLVMEAHIDELIRVDDCAVLERLARNIRLSEAHIDTLLSFQDVHVLRALAEHPNLTDDQIDELIDDEDEELLGIVAKHPNLTEAHIDRLIHDEDEELLEIVAQHPSLTTWNIDEILRLHDDIIVLRILAEHPNLTAAHIAQLINNGDSELQEILAKHPSAKVQRQPKEISMTMKTCKGLDGKEYVFDADESRSQRWSEDTFHDGKNNVSCATGSQWCHEALYLTASGRWIRESWNSIGDGHSGFGEILPREAAIWLVKNNHSIPDELQTVLREVEI
jgi:hypothetical protein